MKKLLMLLMLPAMAWAVEPVKTTAEQPMLDPWVPPAVREKAKPAPVAEGAALRAFIEKKLRDGFDAASKDGTLTREQARAAGLGYVADNFDAIDSRRLGAVRFEDVRRYLTQRGAKLD